MAAVATSSPTAVGDPIKTPRTAGSAVYTSRSLNIYDLWVLGISSKYAWECDTNRVTLPFFIENFSRSHLDIGVATGHHPAKAAAQVPADQIGGYQLTLMDLNESSLQAARRRVLSATPSINVRTVVGNALGPIPAELAGTRFESISMFFLLHCIEGTSASKAGSFRVAAQMLTKDGVLVGSTVLNTKYNRSAEGTFVAAAKQDKAPLAKVLLKAYNKKGIFGNLADDPNVFEQVLREEFVHVETWIEGLCFMWKARGPRAMANQAM